MVINNKQNHFLFYGLTPPKKNTEEDKIRNISTRQVERLKDLDIDAVVLYDIQDESSRTDAPRPFPFMETIAPEVYSKRYLEQLKVPKIIYQSIGKYTETSLTKWLLDNSGQLK